jgi:Holliday junction resolvasome RuvABC DNA-binding subunit
LPASTSASRSRFADVVKFEEAKQALMQLGFKPRAARQALEQACAHVGTDASAVTLVEQALAMTRPDPAADPASQTAELVGDSAMRAMAKQALMQSGYSAGVAERAVDAARAHVGTNADLATLIFEAFRRCTSG